jgi:DNA helicase IV
MTLTHPEHEQEQAYVSRAYALLDQGLADAEQNYKEFTPTHRSTAQAMKRSLDILLNSRGSGQLIFGRVDRDGEPLYIGRRRVYDAERELVVVSWHAPAAQIYYEASPQAPKDVELKRVFVEEDRRLRSIVDEIQRASLDPAVADDTEKPLVSDALLEELERSRDGAMREIVATIQAEQFRIIRAEKAGVLVVQGGPGTGKSVVGLHRAAWLAFNEPELRRQGLLVVAPNTAFLSYISGVLPSLDVTDIHQVDLASLYPGEARPIGADDDETSRVKGSPQMAEVLRRALLARIGWGGTDLELSIGSDRVRIPPDDIVAAIDDVRRRGLPHSDGRDVLRQSLSSLAFRHYSAHQREVGRPTVANESTILRLSAFVNALDRMWPRYTPEELLRNLYATQSWLTEAANGVMSPDERARLYRPAQPSIADEPWTAADLFCLDELAYLINGNPVSYGHVVVDEAQDLSPMQARAIARRCPTSSFTVLGDLAQATGLWVRDSWSELTEHLADPSARIETLSIGYRVPAQVLDLAARQLPLIGPGLSAPQSIRQGQREPRAVWVPEHALLAEAMEIAAANATASLTTALIIPDVRYSDVLRACWNNSIAIGDGRDGDFSLAITLVPASASKGLEFDSVIMLAPDEILASGADGRRLLYIAMTRCTQELVIIHSAALPEGLAHLDRRPTVTVPVDPTPMSGAIPLTGPDQNGSPVGEIELATAISLLSPEDRELVEQFVHRLLR